MKSIDFKSLLIGILGTALVMVLMGQSSFKSRFDVECVLNENSQFEYIYCHKFDLSKNLKISLSQEARIFKLEEFGGM